MVLWTVKNAVLMECTWNFCSFSLSHSVAHLCKTRVGKISYDKFRINPKLGPDSLMLNFVNSLKVIESVLFCSFTLL